MAFGLAEVCDEMVPQIRFVGRELPPLPRLTCNLIGMLMGIEQAVVEGRRSVDRQQQEIALQVVECHRRVLRCFVEVQQPLAVQNLQQGETLCGGQPARVGPIACDGLQRDRHVLGKHREFLQAFALQRRQRIQAQLHRAENTAQRMVEVIRATCAQCRQQGGPGAAVANPAARERECER